ncbi:MAG: class I SAM-dependent methyltransferase [Blastocatellia bacterium]|nr:class I SAM-dependent methyltransferase [Blastocatellia bacterium]
MDNQQLEHIQAGYDLVAEEYVAHIFNELEGKPLDREWLTRLAAQWKGQGTICDLGCGPGHIARFLHQQGAQVVGIDLSPGMIEQARRLTPEVEFHTGNMLALDVPDESWVAIAACYAIVNLPRTDLPTVFQECHRVLKPGGWLMLAFHIGTETVHQAELWGKPVKLDFLYFERAEIGEMVQAAGFTLLESLERDPYPGVEYPSRRAYLLACKVDS